MYSRVTSIRLFEYRNILKYTYSSSVHYITANVNTYSRQDRQRSKFFIVFKRIQPNGVQLKSGLW